MINNQSTLSAIIPLVLLGPYCDDESTHQANKVFNWPPFTSDIPLLPLNVPSRRRYKGFGTRSIHRSTRHDTIALEHVFMRAWEYLSPTDRKHLMTALPVMQPYARLRQFAALNRHHLFLNLRQPRPPPDKITGLCPRCTRDIGAALLSFACDYCDTVRWLGGNTLTATVIGQQRATYFKH
jgi:hypothetical protein